MDRLLLCCRYFSNCYFCTESQVKWVYAQASIPYSSLVPLDLIPTEFQNQAFGGFIFPVLGSVLRVLDVRYHPFTHQGKIPYFENHFPIVGHQTWGGVPDGTSLCLSFISISLFYLCCASAIHLALRSFTENNFSICNCRFVVYRERR